MDEDIFGVGQTAFRLAPAVRTVERKTAQGRIRYAEQELMLWCLSCVQTQQKGNVTAISKEAAIGKIDPVMAMLDACTVLITQKEGEVDIGAMIA